MKNTLIITLLVVLSACKKTPQSNFVKQISGAYNISSITLSKADLKTDSVTFADAGEFFFEDCKIEKSESRGFCAGYYMFTNEPKVNFGYNLEEDTLPQGLRIQPNNSIVISGLNLIQVFDIQSMADNTIQLSTDHAVNKNHRIAVKVILTKK